jgi:hypothetical protein
VKRLTLAVTCDVAGCDESETAYGPSKGSIIGALVGKGWRFGATRDVGPACRDKGHRP